MDTFPLGEFDRSGFYRMILAKSFGVIQDIAQKDGKKVYCGGEDMHEKTFLKSDETFEVANSCNHKRAGDDGFPAQSDSHNCGIFCLMYVAVKVFYIKLKFEIQPFSLKTVKVLLVITIVYIAFYFLNFNLYPIFSILIKSVLIILIYSILIKIFEISKELNELFSKYFKA